jgi:hypothetical protein
MHMIDEMSDLSWIVVAVFVAAGVIMHRLDRIGRQLEAVCTMIRADLPRNEGERDEILQEWRDNRKQEAKDSRNAWIFWGVIGAAALVWHGWRYLS